MCPSYWNHWECVLCLQALACNLPRQRGKKTLFSYKAIAKRRRNSGIRVTTTHAHTHSHKYNRYLRHFLFALCLINFNYCGNGGAWAHNIHSCIYCLIVVVVLRDTARVRGECEGDRALVSRNTWLWLPFKIFLFTPHSVPSCLVRERRRKVETHLQAHAESRSLVKEARRARKSAHSSSSVLVWTRESVAQITRSTICLRSQLSLFSPFLSYYSVQWSICMHASCSMHLS